MTTANANLNNLKLDHIAQRLEKHDAAVAFGKLWGAIDALSAIEQKLLELDNNGALNRESALNAVFAALYKAQRIESYYSQAFNEDEDEANSIADFDEEEDKGFEDE